MGLRLVFDTFD